MFDGIDHDRNPDSGISGVGKITHTVSEETEEDEKEGVEHGYDYGGTGNACEFYAEF